MLAAGPEPLDLTVFTYIIEYVVRKRIIQTEASRRRREAEVQQSMENGLGSCMYVYLYVFHIGISHNLQRILSSNQYRSLAH